MLKPITIIFVFLAALFAVTHIIATSDDLGLYWYWWWFDIFMHSWGGLLIGLGIHSLATFSRLHFTPSLKIVLLVAGVIVVAWEIFERIFGLFNPSGYWSDTLLDMFLGVVGAVVMHFFLQARHTSHE